MYIIKPITPINIIPAPVTFAKLMYSSFPGFLDTIITHLHCPKKSLSSALIFRIISS
jgi:hypothetical protein